MPSIRTRGAVVVAALTALALPAVAGGSSGGLRDAVFSANGDRVRAEVGTYCVSGEFEDGSGATECADAAPPTKPPRPRLTVMGGDRVRLRIGDNPRLDDELQHIGVALAHVDDDGIDYPRGHVAVEQVGPRRWTLTVPDALRNSNALEVFVRLREGDASYLAGLRGRS